MQQAAKQLGMEFLKSEDDLRKLNHPCAVAAKNLRAKKNARLFMSSCSVSGVESA